MIIIYQLLLQQNLIKISCLIDSNRVRIKLLLKLLFWKYIIKGWWCGCVAEHSWCSSIPDVSSYWKWKCCDNKYADRWWWLWWFGICGIWNEEVTRGWRIMLHSELIQDMDSCFEIDPITRQIRNTSQAKVSVVQYDHNSERFRFSLSRFIFLICSSYLYATTFSIRLI